MALLSGWAQQQRIKLEIDSSLIDEDLTDFPVVIKLSTASGITSFDATAVFDALAKSANDDFTGTDSDPPDPDLWTINQTLGGGTSIQSDKLNLVSTGGDDAGVFGNYMLTGDFDIQVDFNLTTYPSTNAWGHYLYILEDGLWVNSVFVSKEYSGGLHRYHSRLVEGGATHEEAYSNSSDTEGKFRIVRSGSTIITYRWNGSSWTTLDTYASNLVNGDVQIYLSINAWTGNPSCEGNFDNFTINSGTVIWPAGTFPNRKKIAVTTSDGTTQCYVEIEHWDQANGKALLHTKCPSVLASEDTILYLYYDAAHADNTTYIGDTGEAAAQAVWDDNFAAVFHMSSDPAGGASSLKDAAGSYHLTPANMEIGDLIDGQAGGLKAFSFDGSDEYAAAGDALSISGGDARTQEIVARVPSDWSDIAGAVYYGDGSTNYAKAVLRWDHTAGGSFGAFRFEVQNANVYSSAGYADDAWHHFVAKNGESENAHSVDLVVDGAAETSNAGGTDGPINTTTTHALQLARQYSSSTWYYADVDISEVRISNVERSAAWLKATYNTLFDTLVTLSDTWLPGWGENRITVTIDSSKIDDDLTDFPVAIHLNSSAGLGSFDASAVLTELADADRKKIAITGADGITEQYVEIENWDAANNKATLHTKCPSILAAADTVLYLYYDAAHADNTTYVGDTGDAAAQSVWDSSFKATWHLAQDPTGGAEAILDSTTNVKHGTAVNMESGDLVDGLHAKGLNFDGYNKAVQLPAILDENFSEVTAELMCKSDAADTTERRPLGYNEEGGYFRISVNAGGVANKILGFGYDSGSISNETTGFAVTDWHHIVVRIKESDYLDLFVDGQKIGTSAPFGDFAEVAQLGRHIGSARNVTSNVFDGIISEARINSVKRSDAWLKATYNTLFDTLVTLSLSLEEAEDVNVAVNFATMTWSALAVTVSGGVAVGTPSMSWEALAATVSQNLNAIGIMSKPIVTAKVPGATVSAKQPGATVSGAGPSATVTARGE